MWRFSLCWPDFGLIDTEISAFSIPEIECRLVPAWRSVSGAAKASVHWLGSQRGYFLDALEKQSVPEFRPYMCFLELAFSAVWQKNFVLERKSRFISSEHFDRFAVR